MEIAPIDEPTQQKPTQQEPTEQKPLRLWPGVVIVVLQWLGRFLLPVLVPEAEPFGAMGTLLGMLAIVVWWAFFSRAAWSERLGAVALMIVALIAASRLIHVSLAQAGMGMLFFIYATPVLCLAFVAWAAASRRLSAGPRWATMVATILLACGVWALLRTDGITGDGVEWAWRWSATPEERLLARADDDPAALPSTPAAETGAVWPGFRGPDRDGVVRGVRGRGAPTQHRDIATDWSASPPVELWRREVGPGMSSFAASGDLLYTQEQRGDDEIVASYRLTTGEPVWKHRDEARFWDSHVGAGPRATPTLSDGRIYALGATGILNALDAGDGTVVWTRNAASDSGAKVQQYGFTSSPVVTGDVVIVHAGALAAYDVANGEPRWSGPASVAYGSPHLLTLDGGAQILMLSGAGATSVAPADGTLLWEHPWAGSIVQPAQTADGDVLINASGMAGGLGMRRLAITHGPGGWTAEERWTSKRLKPNFNDFVVHQGHAYGFDGRILACIDLEDGERKWKGGRYGNGQLLLLADQDLLLVVSEKGELVLVKATPDDFTELTRFPAIEGKTWNHPALAGDLLLVRNAREMAAFRLTLASG